MFAPDKTVTNDTKIEYMEINRDIYLQKLIDRMGNGKSSITDF